MYLCVLLLVIVLIHLLQVTCLMCNLESTKLDPILGKFYVYVTDICTHTHVYYACTRAHTCTHGLWCFESGRVSGETLYMCLGSIYVINTGSINYITNHVNKPTTDCYHNTPPLFIVSLSLSLSCADISLDIPERKRGDKAAPSCALVGEHSHFLIPSPPHLPPPPPKHSIATSDEHYYIHLQHIIIIMYCAFAPEYPVSTHIAHVHTNIICTS